MYSLGKMYFDTFRSLNTPEVTLLNLRGNDHIHSFNNITRPVH